MNYYQIVLTLVLISKSGISGTGTLLSVTFEAKAAGEERLQLHNVKLGSANRSIIFYEIIINPIVVERSYDVNGDGMVNILDLTLVSQNFGQVNPQVDVNDDGTVDIFDLIAVAQDLATTPLAPSVEAWNRSGLNPEAIQNWIDMAHAANDGSLAFRVGIANLEHLLEAMRPDQTSLLANYPNPFNPETWIPYQLAHAADVMLTIYDTQGTLVRQLDLGYQHVGYYTDKTRAAYWDGRNRLGEAVGEWCLFLPSKRRRLFHHAKDGYPQITQAAIYSKSIGFPVGAGSPYPSRILTFRLSEPSIPVGRASPINRNPKRLARPIYSIQYL